MNVTRRLLADSLPSTWAKIGAGIGFVAGPAGIFRVLLELIPAAPQWEAWAKILLLAGVYAVIGIAFLIVLHFLALKKAYARTPEDENPHRLLCRLDGEQIGLIRIEHTTHTDIANDFSAKIFYQSRIKAIAPRVDGMEHFASVPSRPAGLEGVLVTEAEERREGHTQIRPVIARQTANDCFFVLNFVPPLRRGQEIMYSYRQNFPAQTFITSADELAARRLDFDYSTDMIPYPTERLVSTVVFPHGFIPQWVRYDVWMGKAFVRHVSEYVRLETLGAFESGYTADNRLYMKLDVQYPVRGLIYVLRWMPPGGDQQRLLI